MLNEENRFKRSRGEFSVSMERRKRAKRRWQELGEVARVNKEPDGVLREHVSFVPLLRMA